MHQALSLDLKDVTPPLPPQTTGVHHLVVSPCCTDQAITFRVSGGYISHTGHFLRQQSSGDCCPTVPFSFFLFKSKTLLLQLTCAEPGTSIHCRAVRKGRSIANIFSYNVYIKAMSSIVKLWKNNFSYIRFFMCKSTPCLLTTSLS